MTSVEIENVRETVGAIPPEKNGAAPTREVRHEYTRSLPPLLNQLGISLLVSTYQAGKVVAVGVTQGELTLSYHNFERAVGLAVKPDCVAVGSRAQVWFLRSAPDLAARVEPASRYDACFQSDGTAAGTVLVADIDPAVDPFTNVNGTLFFTANDVTHGIELWKSDGTAAGTTMVSDINPGSANSSP